ncbi:MAG: RNA polymerase sigma factor [Planctomycetota bacterium]
MAQDSVGTELSQALVDHADRIVGYLYTLGASASQIEEVVQEVAVSAGTCTEKPDSAIAWLLTVARRRFIDLIRRNGAKRQQEYPISALVEAVESALAENDDEDGPPDAVATLRGCLDRLAPRARELINLRYWGSLSPPEIAGRMQWSEPAVRVALHKARRVLEECLQRDARRRKDGHGDI